MRYAYRFDGKDFIFEGEGVLLKDKNIHALVQKVKRLKI